MIREYTEKLHKETGLKYSERSLREMRQFYIIFKKQIWQQSAAKSMTWSHIQALLPIKDEIKRKYYIECTNKYNLSRNQLRKK